MKEKLLLVSIILAFTSCQKAITYSCNPETNEWATEHIAFYETASRQAIISLPWARQRAIFSGLSPEKKVQLWKEKVVALKQDSKYPAEAISEFEEWVNLMRPEHFMHSSKEENSDIESAGDILEQRLREVYNLQDEDITFIMYKWTTEDEYYASRQLDLLVNTKGDIISSNDEEKEPYCECVEALDCVLKPCDRQSSGCKVPQKGCGKGGMYDCIQLCG